MPVFPSREWCEEAIRLVNADPEIAQAGDGWQGDFGVVIEPEGPLAAPFVVHVVPEAGRIVSWEVLEDPDDLEDLEPAYVARAPYSIWKALMVGTLDPIEAVLRRRVSMSGDLQPLIERLRYKAIAERVFGSLGTRFVDE
jgi:putative sterol carrier protein